MSVAKVALDGRFVRLEPIEERHREALRPAAQRPEIFSVTTSALGPLFKAGEEADVILFLRTARVPRAYERERARCARSRRA
jgi:hypothetical protein